MSTCMVHPATSEYNYLGSKLVHVEDIVKIIIKFNKGAFC
jgi:hypothetical protein